MRSISPPGVSASTLSTTNPLRPDDPPPPHVEHLDARLELVLGEPDDVDVLVAVGDHRLAFDRPAHRGQAVAEAGRLLELQRASPPPASRRRGA